MAQRVSRADGFGRSTRFYEIDVPGVGLVQYPSVTAALGAVAKPALVPWAAKTEREAVMKAAADLWEDLPIVEPKLSRSAYLATLDRRIGKEKAHSKASAKAMDVGSQAHGRIEWQLRTELGQKPGPPPEISEQALWAFMAYEDWKKQSNLTPLLIEQTVWSNAHRYAGTMDLYCELEHEGQRVRAVADWKVSKGIYPEALLQVVAYAQALVEMGHAELPVSGLIVRLPKVETDPGFEARLIPPDIHPTLFKVFLSVLELWKWLDSKPA
jgi:hypothetical protein